MTEDTFRVAAIAIWSTAAVINFVAVGVALFGPMYHDWRRRPKLKIELGDGDGLLFESTSASSPGEQIRLFHLLISNETRWPDDKVHVFVDLIEERADDGEWRDVYKEGRLPLRWQFCTKIPGGRRIGGTYRCDFLRIGEKRGLWLDLDFTTSSLRDAHCSPLGEAVCRRVTLVAVGDSSESDPLTVTIKYDGEWHADADEMANHLELAVS